MKKSFVTSGPDVLGSPGDVSFMHPTHLKEKKMI